MNTDHKADPVAYVERSLAWIAVEAQKPRVTQAPQDIERSNGFREAHAQLLERKHEAIALLNSLMRGVLDISQPADAPEFPSEMNVDTLMVALGYGDMSGQSAETAAYRQKYLSLIPNANPRSDILPGRIILHEKLDRDVKRKK